MHENGSQPLPLEPFSYVWGNPPSPWHVSIEKSSSFPSSAAIVRFQVSMRFSLAQLLTLQAFRAMIWPSTFKYRISVIAAFWLLSVEISAVIARSCQPSEFSRAN